MHIEQFRSYCLEKAGVTEEFPFGPETLVFKVMGKMFALTGLDENPAKANLKCDPEEAVLLRQQYPAVKPGYHMNKKHWNTVLIDGSIPEALFLSWVDNSYNLVVAGLPKKLKDQLAIITT